MGFNILHPYFTLAYIVLTVMGFRSLNLQPYYKERAVWIVMVFLIILAGFRNPIVDDQAYFNMYQQFGTLLPFSYDALKNNLYNIEWLYVLFGKICFAIGLPFSVFIIIIPSVIIPIKYFFFEKNSAYPILSFLLYMIPVYFAGDIGHMRQAIATAIVFISFYAIKKRKLWLFLLLMFIAKGFHNSSVIFIFAYFIAVIPLNRWVMLGVVALCMGLSPLEVYDNIPVLSNIAPDDVMQGFDNYSSIVDENSGNIKFNDLVSIFYLYFMFTYDKEACKKIPYYEYMRNLTVAGICIYFIFRSSPIFSTRLVSYYFLFGTLTIPCIIASIRNFNLRRYIYTVVTAYSIFYFFVFASMQGKRAYSPTTYSNWLIGG